MERDAALQGDLLTEPVQNVGRNKEKGHDADGKGDNRTQKRPSERFQMRNQRSLLILFGGHQPFFSSSVAERAEASAAFSTVFCRSSASSFRASFAFLYSFWALPRERASSGMRFAPNKRSTTTTIRIISGIPRDIFYLPFLRNIT